MFHFLKIKKVTKEKEVLLVNNTSIVNATMDLKEEVNGRGKTGGGRSQKQTQRSSGRQQGGSKKVSRSAARSSDHGNGKKKERTGKTLKKKQRGS